MLVRVNVLQRMTVDKDKKFHMHHYSQDTSKRFIVSAGSNPGTQWVLWKQWGFLSNVGMQCLEGHLYRHCQRNFWSKQELGPDESLVFWDWDRFLVILLFAALLVQQWEMEGRIETILRKQLGLKKTYPHIYLYFIWILLFYMNVFTHFYSGFGKYPWLILSICFLDV